MKRERKLYRVTWFDHRAYDNVWLDIDEIETHLASVDSVGYIVRESPEAIALAQTVEDDNNTCRGVLVIGKKLIKSKRVVK